MKKILIAVCIVCIVLFVSCSSNAKNEELTDTSKMNPVEKYYYVMGNFIVSSYTEYYPDMDADAFAAGAADFAKGYSVTDEEINKVFSEYNEYISTDYLKNANDFLAENAKKQGVITVEDGLQYKLITAGNGESAEKANTVTVDYELTLTDGTIADSSIQRGTPAQFPLSGVIKGFAKGIRQMHVGDTITLWIHPDLGYGVNGGGSVHPNEMLTFNVTLISIDN